MKPVTGSAMTAGTVKYVAVREHLQRRIATMEPGDQLPTEPVLCQEYGVSRITLRRAVDDLIRDGLIVREQGRGTFVTEPRYTQQVRETFADRVTGFFRQQTELGREVTTEVLANHLVRDATAAAALGVNRADELVELERLRFVNGQLHQHVYTYLPAARFRALLDVDLGHGSLFDLLARDHGVTLVRNDLLVRLDHPTGAIAAALRVEDGACVLAMESLVFDQAGTPVAFGIARHTPGNSEIAISLGGTAPGTA
jgi:GntR family transcriptional regulator